MCYNKMKDNLPYFYASAPYTQKHPIHSKYFPRE